MAPGKNTPGGRPDLFHRDGVFYARLTASITGEPLEVALHGITSEEHARAAAGALMLLDPSPPIAQEAKILSIRRARSRADSRSDDWLDGCSEVAQPE